MMSHRRSSVSAPSVSTPTAQTAVGAGAGNAFAQQQLAATRAKGAGDGQLAMGLLGELVNAPQVDEGAPGTPTELNAPATEGEVTRNSSISRDDGAESEVSEGGTVTAGMGGLMPTASEPSPGSTTGDLKIEPWTTADGGTRTTVGVGEKMEFHCSMDGTSWSSTGGTNGRTKKVKGRADIFQWTAPKAGATVTITAKKGAQTGTIAIRVVEPTGVTATRTGEHDLPGAGAGMTLSFAFNPSGADFSRCQWYEEPRNATNKTGYFSKHTPPNHDRAHGAGRWIYMNEATDTASFGTTTTPYEAGSYDWVVPTKWRVIGTTDSNDLVTTTQHHEIKDASGTAFVSKHGVTSPDQAP